MGVNSHKEEVIFDRSGVKNIVFSDHQDTYGVLDDIEKIKNNKENVFIFNSGHKADFLYERSCINDLSFNYFQIYNENINMVLKKIINGVKDIYKEYEISITRNNYYISSEYEDNLLEDYWYDSGGTKVPSLCGYWVLESKDNSYIKINEKKINTMDGSLIIFEAGRRTEFKGILKAISFNISNLSKLTNQYPQKWMPMIIQ
jgi:hypothetical protein